MPFPPESKEQIYSDICEEGLRQGFIVVPEFKLRYQRDGQAHAKWVDVAWLVTFENRGWKHELPQYQVVAAFEVDGFDVPLPTIEIYSDVYPLVRQSYGSEFPCYVPLYSRATHRSEYGLNVNMVQEVLAQRKMRAARHGDKVTVCNGAQRNWLAEASELAADLRRQHQ